VRDIVERGENIHSRSCDGCKTQSKAWNRHYPFFLNDSSDIATEMQMITRTLVLASAAILLSYTPSFAQSNNATECGTVGCADPGQTHQSLGDGTNVGPGSTTGTGMGPQSDSVPTPSGTDTNGTSGGGASGGSPSTGGTGSSSGAGSSGGGY
jgi:hypothetical protein